MKDALATATVFLVDDDISVLRALGRLVRSAGWNVAEFSSPRQFLQKLPPQPRGCVVLDVTMAEVGGLEVQLELARSGIQIPIVFLTGDGDVPTSVHAIKAGAADFLSKPCLDEELFAAIRRALAFDERNTAARAKETAAKELVALLTAREFEVMLGVVAGRMNKQIAAQLGIVEKTVKVHRARVMQKMCVASVPDLVRLTQRAGFDTSIEQGSPAILGQSPISLAPELGLILRAVSDVWKKTSTKSFKAFS